MHEEPSEAEKLAELLKTHPGLAKALKRFGSDIRELEQDILNMDLTGGSYMQSAEYLQNRLVALQSQADGIPGATPAVKQVLREVIRLLDKAIGTISPGRDTETIKQDAKRFMDQTVEGIKSCGEAGRDIGQTAADCLNANSPLGTAFEVAGEGIGIAIGVGINAAGMGRSKAGGKAPKLGKANSSQSTHPRLNTVNNRKPINSEYAGKVYPLEKLPEENRFQYNGCGFSK
jgi:hypothetical protein